jgi:hypothetical protein
MKRGLDADVDREVELARLAEADRHIVNAERNVSEQSLLVEKLRRDGRDAKLAEETLRNFETALGTLRQHRDLIISTIEQIDRGLT